MPGAHFQVRISSTDDPAIFGFGEDGFAIAGLPAVQLTSPNGSERLLRGSRYYILWRSNGLPDTDATVELYKSGQRISQIGRVRLLDGIFAWPVPGTLTPGSDYKIKITSLYDPAVLDWSDLMFTIEANTAVIGRRWTLY